MATTCASSRRFLLALVALMALATLAYAEAPRKLLQQTTVTAPFTTVGTGGAGTAVATPWARVFTRPDGTTAVDVPGILSSVFGRR